MPRASRRRAGRRRLIGRLACDARRIVRRVDQVAADLGGDGRRRAPSRGRSTRRGRGRSIAMSAAIRAGRGDMTTTRSARNTASGIEWVTRRIVGPVRRHSVSSSALNRSRVSASRALNGSSMSRTRGSSASARAIATRWLVPPDSVDGLASANSRSPTRRSSSSRPGRLAVSRSQPASSIGKRTFSSAVRQASRRGSWNTSPTRASGPWTAPPSIATEPASGAMSPATRAGASTCRSRWARSGRRSRRAGSRGRCRRGRGSCGRPGR